MRDVGTQNGGPSTKYSSQACDKRKMITNVNSKTPAIELRGVMKNKSARSELHRKYRQKCALERRNRRIARRQEDERAIAAGQCLAPRLVPKTIENQRIKDDADMEDPDDEIGNEDADDEFASHFNHAKAPRVMITTGRKPSGEMFYFLENLFTVIPNMYYYARRAYHVQEIIRLAISRGFTDLLVFNENRKFSKGAKVNGMLHVHLPEGPTCLYRLSSLVLSKKIRNHGRATRHYPELILNNFSTRLGHRIARMFASVFPQNPDFKGRRVVTIHNQRDYIFFRHHRYIFEVRKRQKTPRALLTASDPNGARRMGSANYNYKDTQGSGKPERESMAQKNISAEREISTDVGKCGGAYVMDGRGTHQNLSEMPVHARLQELGPRFTLKLISLQKGTFDSRRGEYEYHSGSDGSKFSRRKFVL